MGGAASKMCGSQNVSGPEIAGHGVGAAHAAAAATSQGTGGQGTGREAPESVASSQAAETAKPVSKQQIAYLLRLGLNRREVCVDTRHSNVLLFLLLCIRCIDGSLP